jgi:subtilisin family serine protease
MKSSNNFFHRLKAGLCVVLTLATFATYTLPAMAVTPAAPKTNAQLLGLLSAVAPARYIVRDSGGLLGINATCLLFGCTVVEGLGDPQGQVFLVTTSSLLSPVLFISQLLSGGSVVDAEPDQTVGTLATTAGTAPSYLSDETPVSYYGATVWHGYVAQTPNEIVRTSTTQSTYGVAGYGVTVALIDTGVDPNNTILKPLLVYGYDFTRNQSGGSEMGDINQSTAGVLDSAQPAMVNSQAIAVINQSTAGVLDGTSSYSAFGHGTMTAGIVHLVAPKAKLMPLKAFNASGQGYASDVLRAIYYAVNHGAKVINMSFDFSAPSVELSKAINYATGAGAICVASAGNSGQMTTVYPGGYSNVIDVASTSNTDTPSNFSNYGAPPVWISAPGEAVVTTYPYNTYAAGWGTSFSAPFVSGTVALMASVNPLLSPLLNHTTAANALTHAQHIPYSQYGHGILDSYQAVQAWRTALGLK